MSYSYIKSVFPKFESSKIYDERIYNSLSSLTTPPVQVQPSALNEQLQSFAENLVQQISSPTVPQASVQTPQVTEQTQVVQGQIEQPNNLKFYNQPLPEPLLNQLYPSKEKIETFESCESYTTHILSCKKCSAVLTKQLGINNDNAKIQEVMELASYIIFGIFILLLLENIKRK